MNVKMMSLALVMALPFVSNGVATAAPAPFEMSNPMLLEIMDESSTWGWCQNRIQILQAARAEASMYAYQYDFEGSVIALKNGLTRALSTPTHFQGALTHKAIARALTMAGKVEVILTGRPEKDRLLNYILMSNYSFIEEVATNFDIPYYQPGCRNYCGGVDPMELENLFIQYSQRQVEVVLDRLFIETDLVYPIGNTKASLELLKLTLSNHVSDLNGSLWRMSYACEIARIQDLIMRLNIKAFPNEVMAVQWAYAESRDILQSENGTCGGYGQDHGAGIGYSGQQTSSYELIDGSMTVSQRENEVLELGQSTYVENIIISSIGVGREAMFEIVVNGKVKGTIHVPGNDPTYFVTVRERASQVVVRVISGTARITSMVVNTK